MRTLLTLTSVVIGVAGAVAITATTRATHRAYHVLFEAIGGRAALEVVAEGQGGFDAGLVDELATTPGVQAAVGVICTPAALITKNSTTLVITMGVDPIRDVEGVAMICTKGGCLRIWRQARLAYSLGRSLPGRWD